MIMLPCFDSSSKIARSVHDVVVLAPNRLQLERQEWSGANIADEERPVGTRKGEARRYMTRGIGGFLTMSYIYMQKKNQGVR